MFVIDDGLYTLGNLTSTPTEIHGVDVKFRFSKRFIYVHYMNWTEEQIAENEKMWVEENAPKVKNVRNK